MLTVGVRDGHGQRVGGVIRTGNVVHVQQELHHVLHLMLVRTAIAGDRLLDLHRRIFIQLVRVRRTTATSATPRAALTAMPVVMFLEKNSSSNATSSG